MSVNPDFFGRSNYHHGDLRRALLDAAFKVLQKGNENDLGVRELARQVGVTPTAVYRHFSNKEALLVALAADGFRRLTDIQAAAYAAAKRQGSSDLDAFRAGGLAYIRFARAQPGMFRLMFGRFANEHRNHEALAVASRENGEITMTAVRKLLGERAEERDLLGNWISAWSVIHGLSVLLIDGHLDAVTMDDDALFALVLDCAINGLHAASMGTIRGGENSLNRDH